MDPRSSDAPEPGAPWRALDSLSVSGDKACAPQPSSPQQSNSQPPTHSDQLQEVLGLAEDVATDKLHLTPDDEPIKFTISQESWLKLQEDPNFDLCTERNIFRVFFDSSRRLVTIMPPPSQRHQSFIRFLTKLGYKTIFDTTPTLASKILIDTGMVVQTITGEYESSEKVPDLVVKWKKDMYNIGDHTIVEVGNTQPLNDLRYLARLYLNGDTHIQRVILIDITETPRFRSLKSIDTSQEFRRDERTGAIWFGNVKVVGETKILWEVWERDTAGVPQPTFQEVFAFGEMPSRSLPFLTITSEGVYGDATTWRGVDTSITPQMIKNFWMENWANSSYEDARRRMFPLLETYARLTATNDYRVRRRTKEPTGSYYADFDRESDQYLQRQQFHLL
ncbi:hypothetical protein AYL99_11965 [Fonsecaea erecta]|uniref:Uncharacterized protein n=1 Tax=Fonsecaea erecta TaxID=1367422 RepID=A0A178Z209_9EURO|nr:hypothetical protein AYL99_11965 [Fonsecaea erecta]OAP53842.1 hypothetical protein AYL99_11965 [Fonsecaea erecta]